MEKYVITYGKKFQSEYQKMNESTQRGNFPKSEWKNENKNHSLIAKIWKVIWKKVRKYEETNKYICIL